MYVKRMQRKGILLKNTVANIVNLIKLVKVKNNLFVIRIILKLLELAMIKRG